jgi:hypothetical protein
LGQVIEEIRKDSELGAVILIGAGDKAFVSGADINELSAATCSIIGFETSGVHQSILNQLRGWENLISQRSMDTVLEEGWNLPWRAQFASLQRRRGLGCRSWVLEWFRVTGEHSGLADW